MSDNSDQRISFTCPECEAHLKVPAKLAGVSGPCPKCHSTIAAPEVSIEEDPPLTPEPTSSKADSSAHEPLPNESDTGVKEASLSPEAENADSINPLPENPENESERTDLQEEEEDYEEDDDDQTTYRILPASVPDAKPTPAFPPLPSPTSPTPKTEIDIPDFGSTMPVSPVPHSDDNIPDFGSTMPVSPVPPPPIADRVESNIPAVYQNEAPVTAEKNNDPIAKLDFESAEEQKPKLLPIPEAESTPESGPALLPIPELDLQSDSEPGLDPITESNTTEQTFDPATPFLPFFLPGQTPPSLDLSIHAPPVYPGSSPILPTNEVFQGAARKVIAAKSEPKPLPDSPPTSKTSSPSFVFPSAESSSSEPLKNSLVPKQTTEHKNAAVSSSRVQNERGNFLPLIKGLIIVALIMFTSIGLLIADFYMGGIGFLHKLPGFSPASSFVSAVLTPPDVASTLSEPEQNPELQSEAEPKSDTISQADRLSPIENENTIVDMTSNVPKTPLSEKSPTLTDASTEPDLVSKQDSTNGKSPAMKTDQGDQTESSQNSPLTSTPTQAPDSDSTPSSDPFKLKMTPAKSADSSFFPAEETVVPPSKGMSAIGNSTKTGDIVSFLPDATSPDSDASPQKTDMIRAVPVELPNAIAKNTALAEKPKLSATVISTPHSGSADKPPAPGAKQNQLEDPRKIVEAFLHAKSWKERLPYIFNAKNLSKTIEEYYETDPQGPISNYTLEFINMERSRADNSLFYVFFYITKQMPDGLPLILRTEDGKLKVDWEIFAEFHDQHFKYFVKGENPGPHPLRIMIKRASYWGPDKDKFTDLNDYLCFGISSPPYPEEGEFAFIKKGSPLAAKLEQSLPWGKPPVSGIVEIEKVKLSHGDEHLIIKNIVTDGWFSPTASPQP